MGETKYICEPHYDENGNFDYWNPLFPYKRDTCEGCVYDGGQEIPDVGCDECCRYGLLPDRYIAKVVE